MTFPYLQSELTRVMELNRKTKPAGQIKKTLGIQSPKININGNAKCVSRKCSRKNVLDMTNIGAFGICAKCGESEHFRCAGTKEEEKKEIIDGEQNYICSKCIFKSPIAIVCENSIPNAVTTVAQINPTFQCNVCDFVGESKNKLAKHMGDIHGKHPCNVCGKKFWLKTELDMHKYNVHVVKCAFCDENFRNETDLQTHIKEKHEVAEILLTATNEVPDLYEQLALTLEEQTENPNSEILSEKIRC